MTVSGAYGRLYIGYTGTAKNGISANEVVAYM